MFDAPGLERLSKVRPQTVLALYVPIVLLCTYLGLASSSVPTYMFPAYFLLGGLSWTLFEYLFHRFIFHFIPRSDNGFRLQFIMHGVHHRFPHDKNRLVMPVTVSIPVALLIWCGASALLQDNGFALFAGFVFGYICYDMIHYSIHHFPTPKQPALRAIWVSHLKHHFKNPHRSFGVTTPVWDYVFGTHHSP